MGQKLPTREEIEAIVKELRRAFVNWDDLPDNTQESLTIYKWTIDHGLNILTYFYHHKGI